MTASRRRSPAGRSSASVNVSATSANAAQQFLLGAGFGKNVGVGAAIGYTTVNSSVLAKIDANVSGQHGQRRRYREGCHHRAARPWTPTTAGGGGLYFGAQASVAVGNVSNTVTAQLGGIGDGNGRQSASR